MFHDKRGFTLLELLLVIAIIASLAGIILMALNPAQRLDDANSARYETNANDIEKAINSYILANQGSLPAAISALSYGYYDICKEGQSTGCVNLDILKTGGHISGIPIDTNNSTTVLTGFKFKYDPSKTLVDVYSNEEYTARINYGTTFTESLVGYWKMDEAADNTCAGGVNDYCDSSGFGNNAAQTGGATHLTGKFGNAANLDATDDYITISDNTQAQLTTAGSVSAWIYPEAYATAGNWKVIINKGSWGAGRNDYGFYYENVGNICYIAAGATLAQNRCIANTNTPLNTWNHLSLTWDSTTYKFYINGVLKDQGNKTENPNTASFNLEFGHNGGSRLFDGLLDDIRIYNRTLNLDEISALYNYGAPPVAHWRFDEGSGTIAYDSSGNGNNATKICSTCIWQSGIYGGSIKFAGSLYYSVGDPSSGVLDFGTGSMTIELWFKDDGNTASLINKYSNGYEIRRYTSDYRFQLGESPNYPAVVIGSFASVEDGQWHHLVGVRDKTMGKLYSYLDGKLIGNANDTTNNIDNSNGLLIGNGVSGNIDDVQIYNYARTQAQIIKDMNNQ